VAATVLLGFAWALLVPGGQSPDEPAHIGYAQVFAERLGFPKRDRDEEDLRESAFSTEQRVARDRSHQQWQFAEPRVKSEWNPDAERNWDRKRERLVDADRSDGGGPNSASGNPPLYYAYLAVAYHAAGAGHFFDRLYAMRLWSVLLLGLAVVATWLLAGELTARNRLAQLVAAGVVGMQPMASFISASINPDAALVPLWALTFWLGVRLLRRPVTRAGLAALLAAMIAALLVKASSLALVPAVALVLVLVARRSRAQGHVRRRQLAWLGAGAAGVAALGVIATSGRLGNVVRFEPAAIPGFASYLWQAYFPNLPFQTPIPGLAAFAGYDTWIRSGWAAFGWLEVQFPSPVYVVLAVVSVGLVVGGLVAMWRGRFSVDRGAAAFLGLAAVVLVAVLHWAEYRQFVDQQQSFLQGRYYLPLLPIGGLLTAAALANLPARWRPAAAGAVLGALLVLQLFSLGLVAARFYV
jgi:4-amino-4-deoxy-L-arabinose transferase-like glycosyltransferase